MAAIVEALCRVERPASILTWKRSPKVKALLAGLACGEIPLTHQGLDNVGTDIATNHLRSLLETPASWLPATNRWPGSSIGSPRNSRRSPSQPCALRWNNSP